MHAHVVMVNDYPEAVILSNLKNHADLENECEKIRETRQEIRRLAFIKANPDKDPDLHGIAVGYVHVHTFEVSVPK